MAMKLISRIKSEMGGITNYQLAKALGVMPQTIDHLEKKAVGTKVEYLCKLRRLSGLSWSKFGKWLDDEFLSDEK